MLRRALSVFVRHEVFDEKCSSVYFVTIIKTRINLISVSLELSYNEARFNVKMQNAD